MAARAPSTTGCMINRSHKRAMNREAWSSHVETS
jgi:hypothetical protein